MKKALSIVFSVFILTSYSQELSGFQLSACDRDAHVELTKERISKQTVSQDTLYLSLDFSANCCIEPDPRIEYRNDTLFILKGNKSNDHCMCDCCFGLDLTILGIPDTSFIVNVDGRIFEFSESSYVKLPDEYIFDRKTKLNQGNADNLKIGLWRTYYEGTSILKLEEYFAEDWNKPIRKWYKLYDQKGELTEVGIRTMPNGSMSVMEAETYQKILNSRK